jgi:type II secretory pathway component PulJ
MHLLEVMLAAALFSSASASSMQLWGRVVTASQQTALRQQQLERMELDHLRLQAHWQRELSGAPTCSVSSEQLQAVAAAVPVPPQLQRELLPGITGQELRVRWSVEGQPQLKRERLFTPAGLGLCTQEGASDAT